MTKEQAIKAFESRWWIGLPDEAIVAFQLFEEKLCMPFSEFHRAVESSLGRPVWTHEFGSFDLREEFLGRKDSPAYSQILDMIPSWKRVILCIDNSEDYAQ